ncbi:MAG TPA: DUF2939 domain-containing protein [Lysobacter sp.]|nr:DUF2939 domain-containing protein [Lysobacter sp.]
MKKLLALLLVALLILLGYAAAGPFIALHGIRDAIERRDMVALERHVDFPAVRSSLRAQVEDAIARHVDADRQADPLAALALSLASRAAGGVADALATPAGIAAALEGRSVLRRLAGGARADAFAEAAPERWLDDPQYRYESLSRFSATVRNRDGEPVVFVLGRDGLRWKVIDVRLPPGLLQNPLR